MNISYISEIIKILPQKMPSDLEILDYLMQSFNNTPLLNEALEWIVVTAVFLFIFYWFGLGRSQLEDLKVVEEYEFSLGRQLARTSFRNWIYKLKNTGNNRVRKGSIAFPKRDQ